MLLRDSQRHNEVLQAFCPLKHPKFHLTDLFSTKCHPCMHAIVYPGCCPGCHLISGGATEGAGLRCLNRGVQRPWDTSGYPSHPCEVLCHLYQLYMDDLDTVACFTWDRVPLLRQLNHSPERSSLSLQLGVSPSPLYSSCLKTCNQLPTCLLSQMQNC